MPPKGAGRGRKHTHKGRSVAQSFYCFTGGSRTFTSPEEILRQQEDIRRQKQREQDEEDDDDAEEKGPGGKVTIDPKPPKVKVGALHLSSKTHLLLAGDIRIERGFIVRIGGRQGEIGQSEPFAGIKDQGEKGVRVDARRSGDAGGRRRSGPSESQGAVRCFAKLLICLAVMRSTRRSAKRLT